MKFSSGTTGSKIALMLALFGMAGAVWYYRVNTMEPVPLPSLGGGAAASAGPQGARGNNIARGAPKASAAKPMSPQALKLAELEQVPDEPVAGRIPFRFGVKYVPPPTPPQKPYVPPPVLTPQAPPPPDVKLSLKIVVDDPYGKKRAFLIDPSGAMFEGIDGQVIDGRYRLVKVERTSAIVEFLDGTGRKTIFLGR